MVGTSATVTGRVSEHATACCCIPLRSAAFSIALGTVLLGLALQLHGSVLQEDFRRYAGGYGIHTQVIVGLMQNLGIVFGVMGIVGSVQLRGNLVKLFWRWQVARLLVHLWMYFADLPLLYGCELWQTNIQEALQRWHNMNNVMFTVSLYGRCLAERQSFYMDSLFALLFHAYCMTVVSWFLAEVEEEPRYLLKDPTSVSGAFYTKSLASKSLRDSMEREDMKESMKAKTKAMVEEFGMPPSMVGAPVGLQGQTDGPWMMPLGSIPGAAPATSRSTGPASFQPAPSAPAGSMGPPSSMMGPLGPPPSNPGYMRSAPAGAMGPPGSMAPGSMGPGFVSAPAGAFGPPPSSMGPPASMGPPPSTMGPSMDPPPGGPAYMRSAPAGAMGPPGSMAPGPMGPGFVSAPAGAYGPPGSMGPPPSSMGPPASMGPVPSTMGPSMDPPPGGPAYGPPASMGPPPSSMGPPASMGPPPSSMGPVPSTMVPMDPPPGGPAYNRSAPAGAFGPPSSMSPPDVGMGGGFTSAPAGALGPPRSMGPGGLPPN